MRVFRKGTALPSEGCLKTACHRQLFHVDDAGNMIKSGLCVLGTIYRYKAVNMLCLNNEEITMKGRDYRDRRFHKVKNFCIIDI
jgi:hypothetical protein